MKIVVIQKGKKYLRVYHEQWGADWTRNKNNAWRTSHNSQIARRLAKKFDAKLV